MKYGIEIFESFEQQWKTKTNFAITKNTYKTKLEAEKEMNKFENKLSKMNKKAESDLRRNSYGGIQIPKMRVKGR